MNGFIALLLLASILSISLAVYIKRRVNAHGAGYLSLLMLAVSVWSVCYAAELGSGELQTMVFWASCAYFGILLVPPAWLSFTLAFTGRKDLITTRFIILMAVEPLVIFFLV
ncbi:MAG: histidine kinase N-terminal 7TM domain-containing protein, partial [Anaerolineales bacterium]